MSQDELDYEVREGTYREMARSFRYLFYPSFLKGSDYPNVSL
jgi:hypothetical protein